MLSRQLAGTALAEGVGALYVIGRFFGVFLLLMPGSRVYGQDESFTVTLNILAPIVLTESQPLAFSNSLAGTDNDVVIAPTSGDAAKFTATGEADHAATGSIVENSIILVTGEGVDSSEQITIDSFVLGGDMNVGGNMTFNAEGNANDLKVGGTAHILAEDIIGSYSGAATFRLVYN